MAKLGINVGAGTIKAESHVAVVAKNLVAEGPTVLTQPSIQLVPRALTAFGATIVDMVNRKERQPGFFAARTPTAVAQDRSGSYRCVSFLGKVTTWLAYQRCSFRPLATLRTKADLDTPLSLLLPAYQHFLASAMIRPTRPIEALLAALLFRRRVARMAYMALSGIALRLIVASHRIPLSQYSTGGTTW